MRRWQNYYLGYWPYQCWRGEGLEWWRWNHDRTGRSKWVGTTYFHLHSTYETEIHFHYPMMETLHLFNTKHVKDSFFRGFESRILIWPKIQIRTRIRIPFSRVCKYWKSVSTNNLDLKVSNWLGEKRNHVSKSKSIKLNIADFRKGQLLEEFKGIFWSFWEWILGFTNPFLWIRISNPRIHLSKIRIPRIQWQA